jgi:hypothetical protein
MFVGVVKVGHIHISYLCLCLCLCLFLALCLALWFLDLSTVQRTVQKGRAVVHHKILKVEVVAEVEIEVGYDVVMVLEMGYMGKYLGSSESSESVRHEEVVGRKMAESYMEGGIEVVVSNIEDDGYRTPLFRD